MSLSEIRRFGVIAAAFCALAFAEAIAAPRIAIVPLQPGDRTTYDFTSTTYTPGREDHEDGAFALLRGKNGTFEIDFMPDGALNATFPGVLERDGTIDLDITSDAKTLPFIVQRFNQIAILAGSAPATFKTGDSWKTTLTIPLPRDASVDVPVLVTVTAASDGGFDIEGHGDARTRLIAAKSSGSPGAAGDTSDTGLPMTLSLQSAAHFVAGKLVKADGTLHSTVQANSLIDITSKWELTVQKPAGS